MFTDDHPLHSEDVQRAAGPPAPAAAVDELLPSTGLGQSPLLTSLGMNYYLSYNGKNRCFITRFLTVLRSFIDVPYLTLLLEAVSEIVLILRLAS